MATSYPGGLDAFTNPTSGDDLSTSVGGRTHSQMHADVNDALEAVQAELGVNPSGSEATVAARFAAVESDVAALPGGDARVFDVVSYGAVVDGSTDDTAAWQAAIDAAAAAGGGVVTSSVNGVSVIGGALQDTSGANAQLTLPALDYVDTEPISITIGGLTQPPPIVSVIGSTPIPDGHLVLKSTLASGSGALLGAKGPVGTGAEFTNLNLRLENITFRMAANPTNTCLDLRRVAAVDLHAVAVDAGSYYVQGLAEPTSSGSFGLRLPKVDNGAHTRLESVNVVGFYNGFEFSEHTRGDDVNAWGCKVAATFTAANHASSFDRFMAVHCERVLKFTGAHAVDIWQLNVEHAASGWWVTDFDLDDASNLGKGFLRWHAVLAGVGDHNSFTVNGGSGFTTSRVGAAIGSGGGTDTEAVQDIVAAMVVAGTNVTKTYDDTAGTLTLAASGSGGSAAYVYRDRLVAAAGNNVLTLGATPVANSPLVWVNGAIKWPGVDYTISGAVITFGATLTALDVVAVQYQSTASTASASALSGGSVSITDSFTRADSTSTMGTTTTGSKTWTPYAGTWGIASNKAYLAAAPSGGLAFTVVDSGVADCTVSTVLSNVSGAPNCGLVLRATDSNNFYLVETLVGGAYTPKIYKRVSGTLTQIATGASITFNSGDTLSADLSGSSIIVKRNGVAIVSVTDSTYTTQTNHGFYDYYPTTGAASVTRFDDLSITA